MAAIPRSEASAASSGPTLFLQCVAQFCECVGGATTCLATPGLNCNFYGKVCSAASLFTENTVLTVIPIIGMIFESPRQEGTVPFSMCFDVAFISYRRTPYFRSVTWVLTGSTPISENHLCAACRAACALGVFCNFCSSRCLSRSRSACALVSAASFFARACAALSARLSVIF